MMTRIALTVLFASLLATTLGGCASISDFTIDPTEWFDGDWFGNEKKAAGDRGRGGQRARAADQGPEPPAPQAQRPAQPQWPDPPPTRSTQTGGGVQWPDPPPTR